MSSLSSKMSCYQQVPLQIDIPKDIGQFSPKLQVYRARWIMLLIFFMVSICSLMHIMQFAIIADVVGEYYGVTQTEVNWTATVYLLMYILFGFPATYLLEKGGLRVTALIGMGLTCIGSWIKVGAVSPERYYVVLLGQTVIALAQVLIIPIPPKLAAVWFPSKEVASANSVGIAGMEFGLAIGLLAPPLFLQYGTNVSETFYLMNFSFAIVTTLVFTMLLVFFQAAPCSPPSIAQSQMEKDVPFFKSVKTLLYSTTNVTLIIAYGIAIGLFVAVTTLLNQVVLKHYPNAHEDAGWIGLTMVLSGAVGTMICGVILDKYGRFRQTTLILSALGVASMFCYTLAIHKGIVFVYLVCAMFGFATLGIQVTGIELGAELAYPVPEAITAGVLSTSTQVFGIVFTYLYSYILNVSGDFSANLTMLAIFMVEFVLMCMLKYDLRRRAVEKGSVPR
ncbi:hypothetical protein PPYR_09366 [Photinus pyralis]|uniref:Major facilitator superfamily (MFS) profile domain-containing protein n=1 Tax=Photinus pyralis TaxID=7054 RepID=A0A1Y1N7F1_PHOPY|nr:uncharacterized MFS-type transporter C09D4.1-like [Photinus pyralis]KAB0798373.1 hypothetical protein PPYR_09366 [Photinus pyralis]